MKCYLEIDVCELFVNKKKTLITGTSHFGVADVLIILQGNRKADLFNQKIMS